MPRSSTSTSIRPSSARSADPTSPSRRLRLVIKALIEAHPALGGPEVRPDRSAWRAPSRLAGALPARLRAGRARRSAQAAVRPRAVARALARRHDRRLWCRPAPDVRQPVLEVRPSVHLDQQRRPGHDGLLDSRRHRGQGRSTRPHGVGHRRRRLLPDDRAGAGDRHGREHPGQGRPLEQHLPGHGSPVAGDVLRGAVLRGVSVRAGARLRQVVRGDGLCRHAGRGARGRQAGHRQGQRDQRPAGRHRVPHRARENVFPMVPSGKTNSEIVVDPSQEERLDERAQRAWPPARCVSTRRARR